MLRVATMGNKNAGRLDSLGGAEKWLLSGDNKGGSNWQYLYPPKITDRSRSQALQQVAGALARGASIKHGEEETLETG